jgi:small subunit ribosomal protein S6
VRHYELSLIIHPRVETGDVTNVVDRITDLVGASEGQVTSSDVWGRRRLAYPIKNQQDGTYVILNTQLQPAALSELERNLKLSEDILRYMVIRLDDRIK